MKTVLAKLKSMEVAKKQDEGRMCWVCFATVEDDDKAPWVKPCRCRGATMWVHQHCLQRWIDELQRRSHSFDVACPQCKFKYIIVFPKMGKFMSVLYILERLHLLIGPCVVGAAVVASAYSSAASYGIFTLVQVFGVEDAKRIAEEMHPYRLLCLLPMIPISVVIGNYNLMKCEDWLLQQWRRSWSRLPIINKLFPTNSSLMRIPDAIPDRNDSVGVTQILCDGLMLPTVVTIIGKCFFSHIESPTERILMGGIACIAVKGAISLYYKQSMYVRQAKRSVKEYRELSVPSSSSATT